MKSMNDRNDRNDKVMDIILEAATEKYAHNIANETIECDMTDEEEKIMMEQKDRIYKNVMKQVRKESKPHRRPVIRRCAILVASLVLVVGLALNASALRIFLFKTYTDMSGTFLNIKTEKVTEESYDVITEFPKDEVIIPGWLPPGMSLVQITDDFAGIKLKYEDQNLWLDINEDLVLSGGSSTQLETNKNIFEIGEEKILDMDGVIVEIRSETGNNIFVVSWNSDTVRYELSTNASKIMLDTILQDLKYLK